MLRDNKIEHIVATEDGIKKLKRLAKLDLTNNNISSLPPELGILRNIK